MVIELVSKRDCEGNVVNANKEKLFVNVKHAQYYVCKWLLSNSINFRDAMTVSLCTMLHVQMNIISEIVSVIAIIFQG